MSLSELETAILGERVRSVFQQIPTTVLVMVVNATLMTLVLVLAVHDQRAYGWLAAVVIAASLRLLLWRQYRRASPAAAHADQMWHWGFAGAAAAFVSGLLWGGGSVLLMPQSPTYQLFWVFVIGGMCAGAVTLHGAHQPTALAFVLPASLPIAIWLAAQGSLRGGVAAAMILMFLIALSITGRGASRQFGNMVRLQSALAQRTAALDASNQRLRQEMAEHRATEATLRQAQKMEAMGQLTGGIAHDFNNLLTAVLGSLEMLRKRVPADDRHALRLLDNARTGAQRGASLTQRLLAFGRRQALNPESVDLADLVRGMSDLLRSSLGPRVRIQTRFPDGLAAAHADVNQLELALLNLAVNARDAMPEGGSLTIAAREEQAGVLPGLAIGSYLVLSVTDTGEGMSAATLSRAVDPFFTTKESGKGTGLGLSMVHGLAVQSGGQLVLQSREHEGTTAELWLPRAEVVSIPRVAPPRRAGVPSGRCYRILLVDDDPLVRTATIATLEDLGHSAIEAASGPQALEILRAGALLDLVITDYSMPMMTGVQLAEEIARLRPELAVLLATGYAEAALTGMTAYLVKPFGRDALSHAIEDCLGRRGPNASGGRILPFGIR
ncbi:response regulator [Lichenicoccus sp.]|uniref:response regulator n=1 Tax=Lichenicoccus sp. TaxID=2781899 RepID=UPI003D09AADB